MEEKTTSFELIEPASPEDLLPGRRIEPWMISAAVAVICLILALILWKKKRAALAADPLARRNAAWQEAVKSLDEISAPDARGSAVRSSLVLRRYLSLAASDPALFETHEEFIARHDSLNALSGPARDAASAGFTRLAALKYAREIPDADPQTVVADARALLDTLHHGFTA